MYSKCINFMYAIINLNIFLPWKKHLEQLLSTVTLYFSLVWKLKDYQNDNLKKLTILCRRIRCGASPPWPLIGGPQEIRQCKLKERRTLTRMKKQKRNPLYWCRRGHFRELRLKRDPSRLFQPLLSGRLAGELVCNFHIQNFDGIIKFTGFMFTLESL